MLLEVLFIIPSNWVYSRMQFAIEFDLQLKSHELR